MRFQIREVTLCIQCTCNGCFYCVWGLYRLRAVCTCTCISEGGARRSTFSIVTMHDIVHAHVHVHDVYYSCVYRSYTAVKLQDRTEMVSMLIMCKHVYIHVHVHNIYNFDVFVHVHTCTCTCTLLPRACAGGE